MDLPKCDQQIQPTPEPAHRGQVKTSTDFPHHERVVADHRAIDRPRQHAARERLDAPRRARPLRRGRHAQEELAAPGRPELLEAEAGHDVRAVEILLELEALGPVPRDRCADQ